MEQEQVGAGNSLDISITVPHGQLDAFQSVALVQLENEAVVKEWAARVPVDSSPLEAHLGCGDARDEGICDASLHGQERDLRRKEERKVG